MLIAVSGRRARAYIYAHRAQRVNGTSRCKDIPTATVHVFVSVLDSFEFVLISVSLLAVV